MILGQDTPRNLPDESVWVGAEWGQHVPDTAVLPKKLAESRDEARLSACLIRGGGENNDSAI